SNSENQKRRVRLFPRRCGDGSLHAVITDRASARDRSTLRAALSDGAGAKGGGRRQQRRRLGAVEVDEELPGLGGQPQGVPVSRKLDRSRTQGRQVIPVYRTRKRAAAK